MEMVIDSKQYSIKITRITQKCGPHNFYIRVNLARALQTDLRICCAGTRPDKIDGIPGIPDYRRIHPQPKFKDSVDQ